MRSLTKTFRATTLKLGKTEEPPPPSRNFERTVYLSTYLSIIIYLSVYLSEYLNIYIDVYIYIIIGIFFCIYNVCTYVHIHIAK